MTPNLAIDEEGTRMLNLTVLQRLDPAVEDILITAAHVTLYDFDTDLNQWVGARCPPPSHPVGFASMPIWPDFFFNLQSCKDVEGSLFVVKRFVPVPNAVDLMPLLRLNYADFVFGLSPTRLKLLGI